MLHVAGDPENKVLDSSQVGQFQASEWNSGSTWNSGSHRGRRPQEFRA